MVRGDQGHPDVDNEEDKNENGDNGKDTAKDSDKE